MWATRYFFIRDMMYDYNVKVLASSVVSHMYVAIEASDPAERQRSGNWNVLVVSLT